MSATTTVEATVAAVKQTRTKLIQKRYRGVDRAHGRKPTEQRAIGLGSFQKHQNLIEAMLTGVSRWPEALKTKYPLVLAAALAYGKLDALAAAIKAVRAREGVTLPHLAIVAKVPFIAGEKRTAGDRAKEDIYAPLQELIDAGAVSVVPGTHQAEHGPGVRFPRVTANADKEALESIGEAYPDAGLVVCNYHDGTELYNAFCTTTPGNGLLKRVRYLETAEIVDPEEDDDAPATTTYATADTSDGKFPGTETPESWEPRVPSGVTILLTRPLDGKPDGVSAKEWFARVRSRGIIPLSGLIRMPEKCEDKTRDHAAVVEERAYQLGASYTA